MNLTDQIRLAKMEKVEPIIMPIPHQIPVTTANEINRIWMINKLLKQADVASITMRKPKPKDSKMIYDKRTSQHVPLEIMLAKEATLISADASLPIHRQQKSKSLRQLIAKNGAEIAPTKLLDDSKPLPKAKIEKKAFVAPLVAGARGLMTIGKAVKPQLAKGVAGIPKAKRLAGTARKSYKGLPTAQQSGIKTGANIAETYFTAKASSAISDRIKANKADRKAA
ncbi:hypothetical protein [Colwellia piezophila]|uniref:hypothetical protein n=1 Tax=Colwellia piezophila TaxID=211668 RepID=UPI00037D6115|nr:hypothetical protein [Colwellia piezophila]